MSSASECSISLISECNAIWNKKYVAVEAAEEAAQAFADRNNHLHESEEFHCLNQLQQKIEHYKQKADMCKTK